MHYQELYFKQYPLGTMQDYIKYIYQATLGSAHLVANQEDNYQYLIKEYETIEYDEEHILFEEISEELVRVHLEAIPKAYLAYYHHFFMLSVDVKEDKQKLIDAFTSDEVTNNKKVFVEKDGDTKGFFTKSGNERFITVEDSWFDPIRELSK